MSAADRGGSLDVKLRGENFARALQVDVFPAAGDPRDVLAVEIRKVFLADLFARQDEQRTLVFGALTPEGERAAGVNDDL